MRTVVRAALLSFALALATPAVGALAISNSGSAAVTLKVAAGYDELYRPSAWVPVRVMLHNSGPDTVHGSVAIPDHTGGNSQWTQPSYSSLYQLPVSLAPGATKQVTLYLPGQDIGDEVDARFLESGKVVASASDTPASFDDRTITAGVMSDDPQATTWLLGLKLPDSSIALAHLAPATLDPVPEALATFDEIVLTNADTSRLDRDQLKALRQYVLAGGSLFLVGGPSWQETLRPLPSTLLPGVVSGARRLANLSGLQILAAASPRSATIRSQPPWQPTIVSRLMRPRGSILASQAGIPLVVRHAAGNGRIIYLAFDPAVDSLSLHQSVEALLGDLVMQGAPKSLTRNTATGWGAPAAGAGFGPGMMREELANAPGATRPSLILLILMAVFSVLLLGPLNYLLLRRLRKSELAIFTIPALAFVCLGSTVGAASGLRGNIAVLNTITMVQLDPNLRANATLEGRATSAGYPATLYVGLFAPVRGDYHLVWNGRALPQSLPEYFFDQSSSSAPTVGAHLQEGSQTTVDFPSMGMWSTRGAALETTVNIAGTIASDLRLLPDGSLTGMVRNQTSLTLLRPVVLAGSTVLHLPDLPPGSAHAVHIQPSAQLQRGGSSLLWDHIYGASGASSDLASWDGDPWEEPPPDAEKTLIDRLRNVAERLPEARDITALGQLLLIGWSEAPLGRLTVDGATPRRRDLDLIASPLSFRFPQGPFRLRPGTLSAYLVDDRPRSAQNGCCFSTVAAQAIDLAPGGSATFEFDVPQPRHIYFRRLSLAVEAGDADGNSVGQVYDWRGKRWVAIELQPSGVTLPDPRRFISPAGALLVRLQPTETSGDVVLEDPHQDIQLSGWATK